MTRVLVTGVTSYPGRAVADRLARAEVEVHAIVRPTSDLSRLDGLDIRPVLHTLTDDPASVADVVAEAAPDVVVHLAGRYVAMPGPADVAGLIADNVGFGALVVDACVRAGVGAFVSAGSYVQYAEGGGAGAAPSPLNVYAASKEAFDAVLQQARHASGMAACALVLYDTYGPGDWRPRLMAALARAALDGTVLPISAADPALEMVYIDDVAEAFARAARLAVMNPGAVDGRRFAVRTGTPLRISELAAAFERVTGRPVALDVGGYENAPPGVSALWQGDPVPGWTAEVDIDEGIRRFLAAFEGGAGA